MRIQNMGKKTNRKNKRQKWYSKNAGSDATDTSKLNLLFKTPWGKGVLCHPPCSAPPPPPRGGPTKIGPPEANGQFEPPW